MYTIIQELKYITLESLSDLCSFFNNCIKISLINNEEMDSVYV